MPVYKKKKRWHLKVTVKGQTYFPSSVGMDQKSFPTKRKAMDAEADLRKLVMSMLETETDMDLLTACNKYLDDQQGRYRGKDTFNQKNRFCKDFIKHAGNVKIADIAVYNIQKFLNHRVETVSANSYNIYRKEGRCFWNWLLRQGYLPGNSINPFAMTEKRYHKSTKTEAVPLQDVLKVLAIANQNQRDLIETLLRTGARKSEILNLKLDDVDLVGREYILRTNKTKGGVEKATKHHMSDALCEIFKRNIENRHPDLPYVFWHRFYSHKTKTHICDKYQSLGRFTDRLCEKAEVPKFGLHQLRHLAASILKDKGNMPVKELQKFLRHADQKTTEIYLHFLNDETRETTTFLNSFLDEKIDRENDKNGYQKSYQGGI